MLASIHVNLIHNSQIYLLNKSKFPPKIIAKSWFYHISDPEAIPKWFFVIETL